MKTQSQRASDEESGADSGEAACLQGQRRVCIQHYIPDTRSSRGILGRGGRRAAGCREAMG